MFNVWKLLYANRLNLKLSFMLHGRMEQWPMTNGRLGLLLIKKMLLKRCQSKTVTICEIAAIVRESGFRKDHEILCNSWNKQGFAQWVPRPFDIFRSIWLLLFLFEAWKKLKTWASIQAFSAGNVILLWNVEIWYFFKVWTLNTIVLFIAQWWVHQWAPESHKESWRHNQYTA